MKSEVIFILLTLFYVVIGQEVANFKCNEYSQIRKSRFKFLTRVEVGKKDEKRFSTYYEGFIINDRFVLTEVSPYPYNFVEITFINIKNQNDTVDESYAIKKVHNSPGYNDSTLNYRAIYALIELDGKIIFNEQFYPQCVWPYEEFESKDVSTYGWTVKTSSKDDGQSKYKRKSYERLSTPDCAKELFQDEDVIQCFKRTDDQDESTDDYYYIEFGAPLEIEVEREKYIVGLILSNHYSSFQNATVIYTVPFSYYIEWIEAVVWKRTALSIIGCGERKIQEKTPLISFSQPTYHGEFPWHVAIYLTNECNRKRYTCGGSIISNKFILTAAHCVVNDIGIIPATRLTVEVGTYRLDLSSVDSYEIKAQSAIPHEEYHNGYLENDIALIELTTEIVFSNFIQPICVTDQNYIFNTKVGVVPGWGRDETNKFSNILTKASFPIKSHEECRSSNRAFFSTFLNDRNYCAGYKNGTNVCLGDSGGGMVFQDEHERWYIHGIVSLGVSKPDTNLCDIDEYTLFTDVSKFNDWIIKNTNGK